jgi:hypothetical protein
MLSTDPINNTDPATSELWEIYKHSSPPQFALLSRQYLSCVSSIHLVVNQCSYAMDRQDDNIGKQVSFTRWLTANKLNVFQVTAGIFFINHLKIYKYYTTKKKDK